MIFKNLHFLKRKKEIFVESSIVIFLVFSYCFAFSELKKSSDLVEPLIDSPAKMAGSDFNGDGIHDILLGARLNDDGPGANAAGAAYILYGTASFSKTYFLNGAGVDVTLLGKAASDFFSRSLASAGDINSDGFDDIIVGAYQNNDGPGTNDAGAVYILFGHPSLVATIRMDGAGADATVLGKAATDRLGISVAGAGDLNGDGFDDVAMGADQNNDGPGADNAGAVYILYGGSALSANYRLDGTGVNVTVLGKAALDGLGKSLGGAQGSPIGSGGDINSDGLDDLIVGAPLNNDGGSDDEGAVYVLFGGTSLASTIELNGTGVAITLIGTSTNDYIGETVSGIGDINQDGFSDFAAGGGFADEVGADTGMLYIVYGRSSFTVTTIDTQAAGQDVSIAGKVLGDRFGDTVFSAGDVNDDGFHDVIMGALSNDDNGTSAGAAYLLYGGSSLSSSIRLNEAGVDVTFLGKAANSLFGITVASVGDVNNDGFPDLLFGEGYNDELAADTGQAYIVFGTESLSSTNRMDGVGSDVTIRGKAADDRLGTAIGGGRGFLGP